MLEISIILFITVCYWLLLLVQIGKNMDQIIAFTWSQLKKLILKPNECLMHIHILKNYETLFSC